VKTALLPGQTVRQYALLPEGLDAGLIGRRIGDLSLPEEVSVAAVSRFGVALPVEDDLVLEADDQLTVVGPESAMPVSGAPASLG
jgi:Trk K+ transport system NAD-binding subunit